MVSKIEVEKFNKKFKWNFGWAVGLVTLIEIVLFSALTFITTPFLIPVFAAIILTTKYWFYMIGTIWFYITKTIKRLSKKISDRFAMARMRSNHYRDEY